MEYLINYLLFKYKSVLLVVSKWTEIIAVVLNIKNWYKVVPIKISEINN